VGNITPLPTIRQIIGWINLHIEQSDDNEARVLCKVLDCRTVRVIKECTALYCYRNYLATEFIFSKEKLSEARCSADELTYIK